LRQRHAFRNKEERGFCRGRNLRVISSMLAKIPSLG